jgi:hypothetical protein
VSRGLAFAVGVIPAAVVGVAAQRRRRPATALVGAVAGVAMFVGGAISHVPVVAVLLIAAFGVGTALLAQRRPAGRLLMVLALPLVGVGLSYTDVAEAAALGVVMAAGAVWASIVSLAWPERPAPTAESAPPSPPMLGYGIGLGLAGATAAAIGFALDLDHVGWACAAALLVMRPRAEMVQLRAVGRVVSVAVGATLAGIAATGGLGPPGYAAAAVVAVAAAAATHRSRWYVTAAFTTFLALSLLEHSSPDQAGSRWLERMAETLLGVAIAYCFGVVAPMVVERVAAWRTSGGRTSGG